MSNPPTTQPHSKEQSMSTKSKSPAIYANELTWSPAEWADANENIQTVIAHGYELTTTEITDDKGKVTGFDWITRVTAEISETPDVISCGRSKTQSGAQRAAATAANASLRDSWKADRQRKREQEARARELEKAQLAAYEGLTPEEMLEKVGQEIEEYGLKVTEITENGPVDRSIAPKKSRKAAK